MGCECGFLEFGFVVVGGGSENIGVKNREGVLNDNSKFSIQNNRMR